MAKRLLCVAILVLSSVPAIVALPKSPRGARPASFELTMAMANTCGASNDVLEGAAREAARVWAPAGVRVRWVALSELPFHAHRLQWLVVRCLPAGLGTTAAQVRHAVPIAAIRFVGSQPLNTIVMSMRNARSLLQQDTAESRDLDRRFKYLEDARLARMLGRAIAHEIGHFLNESQSHTASGLMKASHSVGALTSRSLAEFDVAPVRIPVLKADAPILDIAGAHLQDVPRR